MRPAPILPTIDTLTIHPLPDPVIDALGHDPRSSYVEAFWLGILGPSTTWLLRHLVTTLEAHPEGFELSLPETARRLGLGDKQGRHSPFTRSLGRCIQFDLAELEDVATLAVRRRIPPLSRRQVIHLSPLLQQEHQEWLDDQVRVPTVEQLRRRARQLALSLLAVGEDPEAAELQLLRWEFHPALCAEAVRWACDHQAQRTERAATEPLDAA